MSDNTETVDLLCNCCRLKDCMINFGVRSPMAEIQLYLIPKNRSFVANSPKQNSAKSVKKWLFFRHLKAKYWVTIKIASKQTFYSFDGTNPVSSGTLEHLGTRYGLCEQK